LTLSNTEKGKEFQLRARVALEKATGLDFDLEVRFSIGNPPKSRPFDLASDDRTFVGECKAFAWTKTGNVPSAKITTLREAVGYLRALPVGIRTFLVLKRDCHPINGQSLADYFARLNAHLLGPVSILELAEDERMRVVFGKFP
jgi:hypothetical protein